MKYFKSPIKTSALAVVRIFARISLIGFCFTQVPEFVHGQAILLSDIGQQEVLGPNEYSELTRGNNRLFFIVSKTELWTSTPPHENPEDTKLVKRFKTISSLTLVGSLLYFIADDGVSGAELWKSNGSPDGTMRVKDIRPGTRGSNIRSLTNVYGTLYFSANDGTHGQELWKSNGGPRNTVMVKDIVAGGGSSNPVSLAGISRTLYFSANDGVHGYELWRSTGIAAETAMIKDIRTEPGLGSSPDQLANVNGTLYFAALTSGKGRELWRSDGTPQGTWLVKDIRPGSIGSEIQNTTAVNKTLFFSATDGVHGQELWNSDGTGPGTVLVKDMTPGPQGSHGESPRIPIGSFKNMYGTLFYSAFLGPTSYIWKSDGTAQGTIPIEQSWGKDASSPPLPQFTWLDNRVYFIVRSQGEDGTYHLSYYDKDGFRQLDMQLLAEPPPQPPYHPELALVNDHLFISGRENSWEGFKIFKARSLWPFFVGSIDVLNPNVGSNPHDFVEYNDRVYFFAKNNELDQDDLWVTDGTPDGTHDVSPFFFSSSFVVDTELINNFLYSSFTPTLGIRKTNLIGDRGEYLIWDDNAFGARLLTNVNDSLYFVSANGRLWKSNGSFEGTRPLRDFHLITAMNTLKGSLIFRVTLEDGSEELWQSNETTGIVRLETIHTGTARESVFYPAVSIGDTHYFVANDGIHGNELWKTRGTAATTSMVIDLNTRDAGTGKENDLRTFITFRDTLYFSAQSNDGMWSLYKTNGTVSGTQKILNLGPVAYAVADGDQLYLFVNRSADDPTTELWKSDGTRTGTTRILNFNSPSGAFHHKSVNGWLYFSIREGGPLWRTNGTPCGTTQVNTGVVGAYPIAAINSKLIFGGFTAQTGRETYAFDTNLIPAAPCDNAISTAGSVATSTPESKEILTYPNPFTEELTFRFDGKNGELGQIRIMTLSGHPVEKIESLRSNTDHTLGKSWSPGVYLIQVRTLDGVKTQLVVKK